MLTLKAAFLALSPEPGVRYTAFDAWQGSLIESEPGSSGSFLILTSDGEVYRNDAVIVDNAYTGQRYPMSLLT